MSAASRLPDKIGRYQILELVGRGGMGILYRAFDPVLDREVAVKVMLADFSEDTEQMRPRFYREAKAAAKLQHRNIVTVFEFAEEDNQPHIVMEFLRGTSLGSRMSTTPSLTLDDKLDIVAQLCAGLGYAHRQGVVHRDVKPANVFLLNDGTVKLLDFGIAKLTTSTLTRQGDVLGSASYMSPEQVAGSESVDGRADVWSAGVVLYELLAGRKPFEGDSPTNIIVKILKEEPPSIESFVPGLPKQLAALVGRALDKDLSARIASAEEFALELQRMRRALQSAGDLSPMAETRYASTQVLKALHDDLRKQSTGAMVAERPPSGPVEPGVAPRVANKWIVQAAAAAAVVLAVVAAWALLGRNSPPQENGSVSGTSLVENAPAAAPPASPAAAPVQPPPMPPPAAKPAAPAATPKTPQGAPAAAIDPVNSGASAADVKPAGTPAKPVASKAPPAKAAMVDISMSAAYVFQVLDGANSLSAASQSHQLRQPDGKTVRLVAPDVFLDQLVRIDGGPELRFEYSPPGLGKLDIRAARGDCRILVGKRDLGYGPFEPVTAVAGDHEVSLSCPDGQNPVYRATVTQGRVARVTFTK